MPADIAVVIPCYRAESTISELLLRVSRFVTLDSVFCVDDGSDDRTAEAIGAAGARLIRHSENRGKGCALQTAYAEVCRRGFRGALAMDADLQHAPEEIPIFLAVADDYDILLGARDYHIHNMPLDRWLTNRVTSHVVSALAGTAISDAQSGYRYLSKRAMLAVPLDTHRYDMEAEHLIRAGRMGLRIGEVTVSTIYGDGPSYIRPGRDTIRFIRMALRNLAWSPPHR